MTLYQVIAERIAKTESIVLVTVIRTEGSVPRQEGTKMLVFPDGGIEGTIGGGEMESQVVAAALESLKEGKPRRLLYEFRDPDRGDVGVCGGEMEVFVEPILPERRLIIIGAGHVGRAIAHLGSWLGFRVVVADDRPDFATPENVPQAHDYHTVTMEDLPKQLKITENDYLILATRGVPLDVEVLPGILKTHAAYIGIIGSKRRWETTGKALADAGIDPKSLMRVHSPMGLEIQAETPEEIAVSVMAEVIMEMHGGSGETMAHQPKTTRIEEK